MIILIGAVAVLLMIAALFRLDRDDARFTLATFVPFVWLLIACSRPVSAWINIGAAGNFSDQYIDGSPLDRNILTVLLLLALYALSKRRRQMRTILSANWPILVFFGFCLISALWSEYPFVVLKRWTRAVGDVGMILLIVTEADSLNVLRRILTRLAYILIPLSILFIRFVPALGRFYSRGGSPEWTGVCTDKNALGMICMLFGVTLLWRGITTYRERKSKSRTRHLIAMTTAFVMILYLLLVVNSQTAFACFGMASIVIVLTALSRSFRRPTFLLLMVTGMVGICGAVLFLGVGGGALAALGRNSSLTGRTEVWHTILPYAVNPWIGAGYENFWIGDRLKTFNRLLGGLNQAHNGYIEIYLNIGYVGLVLLGGVVVAGYRNIIKDFRVNPEAARLKLAFFVICLIYNFTEATFKMMSPVWILFLWATIAVPRAKKKTAKPQTAAWEDTAEQFAELSPR